MPGSADPNRARINKLVGRLHRGTGQELPTKGVSFGTVGDPSPLSKTRVWGGPVSLTFRF